MSLINKMLQDLEAREAGCANNARVYQDLRPVASKRIRNRRRTLGLLVIGILVVAPAALYVNAHLGPMPPPQGAGPLQEFRSTVTDLPERGAAAHELIAEAPISPTPAVPKAPVEPTAAAVPATAVTPESAPANSSVPVVASRAGDLQTEPASDPVPSERPGEGGGPARDRPAERPASARSKATIKRAATDSPQTGSLEKKIRPLTTEETAEDHYRRAARLLEQGEAEGARSALKAALAADPAHHPARELLVGLELQRGGGREAQELLEAGFRMSPRHHPFAQLLARLYLEHGAEARALEVLEAAVLHAAQDPDYLSLLAAVYQRAGRHAEAAQTYRQVLARRDVDARAWLGLAVALDAQGERDPAADAFRRARAIGGLTPALDRYVAQRIAVLQSR